MDPERDDFIFKWFGECPHQEWDDGLDIDGHDVEPFCKQCGYKEIPYYTINLSTWDGFGWLWGKMREDEKLWDRFIDYVLHGWEFNFRRIDKLIQLIDNLDHFADTVRKFLPTLGKSYSEFLRKEKDGN